MQLSFIGLTINKREITYLRIDGWFALVNAKGPVFVMHDTQRIIWSTEGWSVGMFLEVVLLTLLDVGPVDGNIFVSVITAMDMEGSKGMDKFMNDGAE